jgi:arylsulfatase A-like enzyme
MKKSAGVCLLVIGLVAAVIAVQRAHRHAQPPKPTLPNVMIIVMDTARRDHLSCYGYKKNTSPYLNELTKSSRVYYNAYATSGWTASSHASLFTGLFPIAHKTTQENWSMSERLVTLADVLLEHGYQTYGISENPIVSIYGNYEQGFLEYYEAWRKPNNLFDLLAWRINKVFSNNAHAYFKNILRSRNAEKPFYIFINFNEAHNPYNSSRQFYNTFATNRTLTCENNQWRDYFLGEKRFSDEEIGHLTELYDAEILYVDHLIQKIINDLKSRNIWDTTLFIVTSDHGENIGDHNMMDHVFSLHETLVRIPLIIHYPPLFQPGSEDYRIVQLTDVFPTVLEVLNIETETYPSHGVSLLAKEPDAERAVFCEYYYPKQAVRCMPEDKRDHAKLKKFKRRIKSVMKNGKKIIWGSDGKHELFDVAADQNEQTNLIDDVRYADVKQELLELLGAFTKTHRSDFEEGTFKQHPEHDKELHDALRSLGYAQ